MTNYSDILLHGEGVSIGCNLAFDVSAETWIVFARGASSRG